MEDDEHSAKQFCDFCRSLSVADVMAARDVPTTASAGFIEVLRGDLALTTPSDYVGPTIDHIVQNKTSCPLCALVFKGLQVDGLGELLDNDESATRGRHITLRVVNVSGGWYDGSDGLLAGIHFELQPPLRGAARGRLPQVGLRLFPATSKLLAGEIDCVDLSLN